MSLVIVALFSFVFLLLLVFLYSTWLDALHQTKTEKKTFCSFQFVLFFIFSLSSQIHLFDIDVPGKIRFQESDTLSPGSSLSVFETREFLLLSFRVDWIWLCFSTFNCCYFYYFSQLTAKWELGSAMTCASPSSRRSTQRKVRLWLVSTTANWNSVPN